MIELTEPTGFLAVIQKEEGRGFHPTLEPCTLTSPESGEGLY